MPEVEKAEAGLFCLVVIMCGLIIATPLLKAKVETPKPRHPLVVLYGERWANLTVPYNISTSRFFHESLGMDIDAIRWSINSTAALAVKGEDHLCQIEAWGIDADLSDSPNLNLGSVWILPGKDDYELILEKGSLDHVAKLTVYWDMVREADKLYVYSNYSFYSEEVIT